jgi:SAM-dependent methyltransferase
MITFQKADAEALSFGPETFDAATSTFGVMFAPDHGRAAAELLRVVRPGGKIGLANWTPDGFIGEVFKTLGKHLSPAPGAKSPMLWGTRERIAAMFGSGAASVRIEPRQFNFRYLSPKHLLDVFKTYYGPILKAFETLDMDGRAALRDDLLAVIARRNRATDGSAIVPSDYLEIVVTKR